MSTPKLLAGICLGLLLLLAFAVLSYMPPTNPGQILYRTAATQNYAVKSGNDPSSDAAAPYSYSLSFVELNDDGLFVEPAQVERLLADLKSKTEQSDTTILLYVHGWNHNASTNDSNVACFEELLKATSIMQSTYLSSNRTTPRAVYGIYVGWPGVVYENEKLNKALTFFGRQSAADRVGERGALLELFSKIGALRDRQAPAKTKFVIISHSLGARLTYKVLRPIMQHSVYAADSGKSAFVADVAVMVNPALSADEHTALAALIKGQAEQGAGEAQPKFIIATSEKDEVLGGIFPLSQQLHSFVRGDYALADQRRTLPLGLFDEYVTHSLTLEGKYENSAGKNGCPTLSHDELEIAKGKSRVQDAAELYDYRSIKHYDAQGKETYRTVLSDTANASKGPIMVVKVAGDIIPNHNDIFTSPFVDFVSRAINAGLYRPR
ncbi:hypothetical protein D3C78_649420 [compost metagenome]